MQYTLQRRICMHYSIYNLILKKIHIICYHNENSPEGAQKNSETRLIPTTMDKRWNNFRIRDL